MLLALEVDRTLDTLLSQGRLNPTGMREAGITEGRLAQAIGQIKCGLALLKSDFVRGTLAIDSGTIEGCTERASDLSTPDNRLMAYYADYRGLRGALEVAWAYFPRELKMLYVIRMTKAPPLQTAQSLQLPYQA